MFSTKLPPFLLVRWLISEICSKLRDTEHAIFDAGNIDLDKDIWRLRRILVDLNQLDIEPKCGATWNVWVIPRVALPTAIILWHQRAHSEQQRSDGSRDSTHVGHSLWDDEDDLGALGSSRKSGTLERWSCTHTGLYSGVSHQAQTNQSLI